MEKFKSMQEIDIEYQELFYNGNRIFTPNSTLQEIGITNNDEIIVVSHFIIISVIFLAFFTNWK